MSGRLATVRSGGEASSWGGECSRGHPDALCHGRVTAGEVTKLVVRNVEGIPPCRGNAIAVPEEEKRRRDDGDGVVLIGWSDGMPGSLDQRTMLAESFPKPGEQRQMLAGRPHSPVIDQNQRF